MLYKKLTEKIYKDGLNIEEVKDVSIIIVNWKVKDLLCQCLKSVYENTKEISFEITVIDNNSNDGSLEMIKVEFPQIKLICNTENIGFAQANNQGIIKSQGRYILLLNPDTVVLKNCIREMVWFLDRNPKIGAVGPKIRYPNGSIQFACARNSPNLLTGFLELSGLGYKFPKGKFTGLSQIGYWNHNDERKVDAISGACMMVRREVVNRIGLLDEGYFMYGEDIDWCYRIKRNGWQIYYLPISEIIHFAGQSSKLFVNIAIEDYKSMYRFLKIKGGLMSALLYRLLAVGFGSSWLLYWSIYLFISRFANNKPKRKIVKNKVILKYKKMIAWGLGV